jgi:hypothetical protein
MICTMVPVVSTYRMIRYDSVGIIIPDESSAVESFGCDPVFIIPLRLIIFVKDSMKAGKSIQPYGYVVVLSIIPFISSVMTAAIPLLAHCWHAKYLRLSRTSLLPPSGGNLTLCPRRLWVTMTGKSTQWRRSCPWSTDDQAPGNCTVERRVALPLQWKP